MNLVTIAVRGREKRTILHQKNLFDFEYLVHVLGEIEVSITSVKFKVPHICITEPEEINSQIETAIKLYSNN